MKNTHLYASLRAHAEKIAVLILIALLMFGLFLLNAAEPLGSTNSSRPPLLWGYDSSSSSSSSSSSESSDSSSSSSYAAFEISCNDSVDNDGDSLTDCEDIDDCSASESCEEICDNEVDDDGDFAVDCDDLWCADHEACL